MMPNNIESCKLRKTSLLRVKTDIWDRSTVRKTIKLINNCKAKKPKPSRK